MRFFRKKKKKTDEPVSETQKEASEDSRAQSEDNSAHTSETEEKKKKRSAKESDGMGRSLVIVFAILLMHIVLVAGIGLVVLFFSGVIHYTEWILLGGSAIILFCCYFIYRKMKAEGKQLRDIINSPTFQGKSLEISFLGGFASVKLNNSAPSNPIMISEGHPLNQNMLESNDAMKVRELSELARLLEKNFITIEEYKTAKKEIFNRLSQSNDPVVQYYDPQDSR